MVMMMMMMMMMMFVIGMINVHTNRNNAISIVGLMKNRQETACSQNRPNKFVRRTWRLLLHILFGIAIVGLCFLDQGLLNMTTMINQTQKPRCSRNNMAPQSHHPSTLAVEAAMMMIAPGWENTSRPEQHDDDDDDDDEEGHYYVSC